MPFDGTVIYAIKEELKSKIIDSRIEKIYQPRKDTVLFYLRKNGQPYHLLVSSDPANPRIHLTKAEFENPQSPPMFCMLLRKHLMNGRISNITQPDFERIIYIDIESLNEKGIMDTERLIIEIMGRHSNIILTMPQKNIVLDGIKRLTGDISSYRTIIPGSCYISPPNPGKLNPLTTDQELIIKTFKNNPEQKVYKILVDSFNGISPKLAKEIAEKAGVSPSTASNELSQKQLKSISEVFYLIFQQLQKKNITPYVYIDISNQKPVDFSVFRFETLCQYKCKKFLSVNEALDYYFSVKEEFLLFNQMKSELKKIIDFNLKRCSKKLELQKSRLQEAEDADKYKLLGELITSNIFRLKKGQTEAELINYYSQTPSKIRISLDPKLTPSQNAQKYFKKYSKLKNALEVVKKIIKQSSSEKKYFENVLHTLEQAADIQDLNEIRNELISEGYIKSQKKIPSGNTETKKEPLQFISKQGFIILVGRNNQQNDFLTMKTARPDDIWMHTKEIPGAHVIIRSKGNLNIPEETLYEAANLAAFYSKGRHSSNVAVDYTQKKNVRKPKGAKPGMVIYDNYKTIYVTPSETKIPQITNE
ncbi:MAG: hypothetical protein PWQ82_702 [Thermosediminibacterales bacterium]|nr:hypothetical protein [Thermosediminibacterales bacterium]